MNKKNNATVLSNIKKIRGQKTAISERGFLGEVAFTRSSSRSDCGFLIMKSSGGRKSQLEFYKLCNFIIYGN